MEVSVCDPFGLALALVPAGNTRSWMTSCWRSAVSQHFGRDGGFGGAGLLWLATLDWFPWVLECCGCHPVSRAADADSERRKAWSDDRSRSSVMLLVFPQVLAPAHALLACQI